MRLPVLLSLSLLTPVGAATAQERFMATLPAGSAVSVTPEVTYVTRGDRALKFDLYRPAAVPVSEQLPLVVMLNGVGGDWIRGHVQYTSWARYATSAGLAAVTMDATGGAVPADFDALVAHLTAHATALGIDPTRIVIWACSSNVPVGVTLLQSPERTSVVGAALYYGTASSGTFLLDRPVLIARAGRDGVGLNRGLDAMVAAGLAGNAPITVLTHHTGRHGFDIRDDDERSREVMADTLAFMVRTLNPAGIAARRAGALLAEASAAGYRSDWAAASDAYTRLAAVMPDDAEIQQGLGEARVAAGDLRGAIPAFERCLALGSTNRGIVTFALVRVHAKLGQVEQALDRLSQMGTLLRFFVNEARTHPDFEALRAHPRFAEIVR